MFGKKNKKEEEKDEKNPAQKEEEKYEKMIEENVEIHKMPRNIKEGIPEKGSEESGEKKEHSGFLDSGKSGSGGSSDWDKTKVLGAVIMACGIVILIGGVYLGYVYLINPSSQESRDLAKQEKTPSEEEEPKQEKTQGTEKKKEEEPKEKEEKEIPQTTTPETEATTSEEEDKETKEEQEPEEEQKTEEEIAYNDSDSDGLSDFEETILKTDPQKSDSDEDGYKDGEEVFNSYNPQGTGKLINNPNVSEYYNNNFDYSVLYPSSWSVKEISSNGSVMFKAGDGSFIQIIPRLNEKDHSIKEWYGEKFDNVEEVEVQKEDSWEGIRKQGETVFYLTDKNRDNIYVVHLNSLVKNREEYTGIFKMVINSLKIK